MTNYWVQKQSCYSTESISTRRGHKWELGKIL